MSPTIKVLLIGLAVGLVICGLTIFLLYEPIPSIFKWAVVAGTIACGVTVLLLLRANAVVKRMAVLGFLTCITATALLIGQVGAAGIRIKARLDAEAAKSKPGEVDQTGKGKEFQPAPSDPPPAPVQPSEPGVKVSVDGEFEATPADPDKGFLLISGVLALAFGCLSLVFLKRLALANNEPELVQKVERALDPKSLGSLAVVGFGLFYVLELMKLLEFNQLIEG